MRRPMIPLTLWVAVPDEHTQFTRLETNTLLAALGTAVDRHIVHPTGQLFKRWLENMKADVYSWT